MVARICKHASDLVATPHQPQRAHAPVLGRMLSTSRLELLHLCLERLVVGVLLPKRGVEGLPPNAAPRSRLISMDEASPSDSDGGDGGPPMAGGVYMTLTVLVLLATANQWSRAIIFYIVDFSKGARSQPDLFINVALGFDEASCGRIAPNPNP